MKLRLPSALQDRRRGIALIVVLAMATLLTAVAVSLVAAARVDRLAGANYLDSVIARRLVPQAIDAAMRASLPNYVAVTPAALPALRVFPAQDVFVVNGSGAVIGTADAASLIDQNTLSYFRTNNVTNIKALVPSAKWSNLLDSSGKVVGRYAAVVENMSGMVDLNAVTGAAYLQRNAAGNPSTNLVTRTPYRVSPAQMDATALLAKESSPAVTDAQIYDKLVNNAVSLLGRFESLPDIRTYGAIGTPAGELERCTYYSRSSLVAPTYRDALISTNRLVNISRIDTGSPSMPSPTTPTNVIQIAMQDFMPDAAGMHVFGGKPVSRAQIAADALLDYVDTDNVPRNQFFSNERNFMWNEIKFGVDSVVSTALGGGNFSHVVTVVLQSELFYPYVTSNTAVNITNDAKLTVEYTIDMNGSQVVGTTTIDNNQNGFVGSPGITNPARLPAIAQVTKTHTFNTTAARGATVIKPKIVLATVTEGAKTVDVIDPVDTQVINMAAADSRALLQLEALDPRANRTLDGSFFDIPGNPKPWRQSVRKTAAEVALFTMGAVNDYTKVTLAAGATGFFDVPAGPALSDMEMYVSNSQVGVVGELGYLPYSAWRTFKLYGTTGQAAHPVLDYFYSTNCYVRVPANGIIPGQINPNTSDRDVLGLVFSGAALDRFPGEAGAPVVDSNTAINTFAAPLIKAAGKYPYLNPSDAYDVPAFGTALLALPNELRRESLIRNSFNLLTTRNNTLQVLLLVQAVRLDGGDQVPVATEKVLATVWRDPVSRISDPAAGGERYYRYFTRALTYMND